MKNGKQSIHITGVEIRNFQRLTFAQVKVDTERGRLVRVTGPNTQGKTSLLRFIASTLGGKKLLGDAPVHDGADEMKGRLVLTNGYTIEQRVTPEGARTLVVRSPDGGRHGQAKLNEWCGPLAFDPLSFFSLAPDKQADTLLRLGNDPDLPYKLADLKKERADAFAARTPVNVSIRNAKATPMPAGERPEQVDTGAEMKRLAELQREQAARNALIEQLEAEGDGTPGSGGTRARIAAGEAVVATLERQLASARERLVALKDSHHKLAASLASSPDRGAAIAAVQGHIADAQTINEQLKPWHQYDEATRVIAAEQEKADSLTSVIEDCDSAKASLLLAAGIDIPGLDFDEDGAPLLNGQPLSVASGRERIELAVAVAMKANPDLRIALIDEANDLDLPALEQLDQLAQEHDFQIWAVRIGIEGPGEVVVDDGVAWQAGQERPEPAPVDEGDSEIDLLHEFAAREAAEQDALGRQAEREGAAHGRAQYEQDAAYEPDGFEGMF